jgi:hypothetical protein
MGGTLAGGGRAGRVLGIPVGVRATGVSVCVLVTQSLAAGFPVCGRGRAAGAARQDG